MSDLALNEDSRAWLDAFVRANGRRPRVLHIGNIANNAYNNAKLLNEVGLDCDVLCSDYYHIMGCPEWEDADFEGDYGGDFRPDWTALELRGFVRPEWFVQGPFDLCLAYLAAKRKPDEQARGRLWRRLGWWNRTRGPTGALARFLGLVFPHRVRESGARMLTRLTLLATPELVLERFAVKFRSLKDDTPFPWGAIAFLALALPVAAAELAARLILLPALLVPWVRRELARLQREREFRAQSAQRVIAAMKREFPQRADAMSGKDLRTWLDALPRWRELFAHYDVVQAYATYPIIPLLAGKPYFAFEHGTLREIPFVADATGRTTAISYRLAAHVFVTNHDCLDNAHLLAADRVTFINHPYDERHGDHVAGAEAEREALKSQLDADVLFFFPTRHDWVAGTGYADKANDIFLRAFAALRARGVRAGMVCCEWGSNVAQSRALLGELGCLANVKWTRPMGTVRFERVAMASDCVVDQFKLGAFGGVMFKAMAVGRPVCTFLDEEKLRAQYGVSPPAVNCRTEEEIVRAFTPPVGGRAALEAIGAASRRWMREHHGASRTVNAQVDRYRELLAGSGVMQTRETACA